MSATQQVHRPVILVGQPETFTLAGTHEQLRDWEKRATQRYGVAPSLAQAFIHQAGEANVGGTCCDSGGGGDCDVDEAQTA